MSQERSITLLIAGIVGTLSGIGFGIALSTRDWDDSPLLGKHQPVMGGLILGALVAVLLAVSKVGRPRE